MVRHLTIIGEAVANLDSDLKARAPGVPWTDVKGMRNILVHE